MPNSKNSSGLSRELIQLGTAMLNEHSAYVAVERTTAAQKLRESQATLLETVKAIGKSGDIDAILAAEKAMLKNEHRLYGNSKTMRSSLDTALFEIATIEKHVALVRDPQAYEAIDKSNSYPKNRIGGVPRDEARQGLSSHNARLLNMDKSRLTETEKQIVKARRDNLHVAQKAYTAMQHQALGLPPKVPQQGKGLSR